MYTVMCIPAIKVMPLRYALEWVQGVGSLLGPIVYSTGVVFIL